MTSHEQAAKDNITEEHGHGLRLAIELRRDELELRLAQLQNSERQGTAEPLAIETALSMLDQLLPEEHIDISAVLADQLTRWLEANKYLGVSVQEAKKRRS